MNSRVITTLAQMARREPLRSLHRLCESQKQVSTAKLEDYLLCAGDELAGYAEILRDEFNNIAAAPAAPVVQAEQEPVAYWILFDATGSVPYIKKSLGDGFLAFFDNEEDAKRAKRKHHGTDYKRVEYFRAPPAHPDAALVEALRTCEKWFMRHAPTAPLIGGFGDAEHPMLTHIRAVLAGKGGE